MATTANGNGNLVDEFEESFQACLNVLTKDDTLHTMEKDEIRVEVDQSLLRFIDLARQMEAFFLQKRFLLSALKPELIVKEDVIDLRNELHRKEELIKRHYEKIAVWQNLLADLQGPRAQGPSLSGNNAPSQQQQQQQVQQQQQAQQQQQQQQQAQQQQQVQQQQQQQQQQPPPPQAQQMTQMTQNAMVTLQQQQLQQQQHQQMQQHIQQQIQQQQQMQQQGPPMQQPGGPMGIPCGVGGGAMNPQAMFMQGGQLQQQQRAAGTGGGGMVGVAGGFHHVLGAGQGQGGAAGGLQGPLAYLEKTTSNIGMPEARR